MADAFAHRAAEWDANPVRAAVGVAFYDEVLRAQPNFSGLAALEFGCGTGVLGLRLAAAHGAKVTFVDTSPAMLEVLRAKIAEQNLGGLPVHLGDIASLPLAPASQDVILCLMALHHVDDIPAVLQSFRRLLKPGGRVLLGDLLPEDGSFHAPEVVAHNGFDPISLGRTFAEHGLIPVEHHSFHTLRKPNAAGALAEYSLFFLSATAG